MKLSSGHLPGEQTFRGWWLTISRNDGKMEIDCAMETVLENSCCHICYLKEMLYYAPMHKVKLQQMQHGQFDSGLQNIETPKNIQNIPWPASQPMKHQKRIHVSLPTDGGNISWPSMHSACDNHYQLSSPLVDGPQMPMMNFPYQTVTPPPVLVDEALYSCNILAQLQGTYEQETSTGRVQVSVMLPTVSDQEDQYATVHRVSSDGKTLDDQHIYDEPFTFNLKSVDGKLEGCLTKGSDMKHSVTWWNPEEEKYTVWRRNGKVTFNLVQVESKVRRGSISSIRTVSTSPIMAYSVDTPMLGSDDNPLLIRPELLQQRKPVFTPRGVYSANERFLSTPKKLPPGTFSPKTEKQQEEMFRLIKAHCAKNPSLFQKVVDWGTRNNPKRSLSEDVMKSLAEGRVWITAHASGAEDGVTTESLDDIKGGYQRASTGVWMQPAREACGARVQHKLFRDKNGLWTIESNSTESEVSQIRARQLQDNNWVDFKNNKMNICVHMVPISMILEKLVDVLPESKTEVMTSMDFLFTSCNQAKLSNLKGRNLKHHIANLKIKLEKRYALSFGVQIAHIAETIAQQE